MDPDNILAQNDARKNWDRARSAAAWEQVTSLFSGGNNSLIPFDEVQKRLHLNNKVYRGVKEIPLDQIRGSVGRYRDFTQSFLPKSDTLRKRWEQVSAASYAKGLDPIEVYKVGDAYFVVDGNHRCSIARQNGQSTIEAHVWEFKTPVGLSAGADFEEVLLKEERQDFLAHTHIHDILPEAHIEFTELGRYREIEHQIDWYQQTLEKIDGEPFSYEDAVHAWYEMIYTPLVQLIRQRDLMRRFPERTESDLFIWLWKNHRYLQAYNRAGSIEDTIDLLDNPGWRRKLIQFYDKVMEWFNEPEGDW